MKTKEEKEAKRQRRLEKKMMRKRQEIFKHRMEVVRTTCSFLGLALNLWVIYHLYYMKALH